MRKRLSLILMMLMCISTVAALDVSISNYDPLPAESGNVVNVWIKVENQIYADTVDEVYIDISPRDGLELTAGEVSRKKIGVLEQGSSQIVKYRLFVQDDAFDGSHLIYINLTSDQTSFQKNLFVEVIEKDYKDVDLDVGEIQSDPARIKPNDDEVKFDITLLNLGDGTAKGVRAELQNLPEGFILTESYSGSDLIGNIEADGTKTVTFYFDVEESVRPIEHSAQLELKYKYKPDEDENEHISETKFIPIRIVVKAVPLYEITEVKTIPEVITAGDDVKILLTVKNVGREKGESVRIKAFGKTEQPFNYDVSSDYIAPSLKPGEEGQATIQLSVNDDANLQKYFIDVEVKNIVNDEVLTYDKKIPLTVTNPMPDNPWSVVRIGMILIGIAIVVIVFNFIRSRFKKPKTKKIEVRKGKKGDGYLD